jgi:hypothetical protein
LYEVLPDWIYVRDYMRNIFSLTTVADGHKDAHKQQTGLLGSLYSSWQLYTMPTRVNVAWIMNRKVTFNFPSLSVFRSYITKFRSLTSKHLFIHASRGFRCIRTRQLGMPRKSYCAFLDRPQTELFKASLNKAVYSPSNRKEFELAASSTERSRGHRDRVQTIFSKFEPYKIVDDHEALQLVDSPYILECFRSKCAFNERYFVGRDDWGMASPTLPSLHGKDTASLPGSYS